MEQHPSDLSPVMSTVCPSAGGEQGAPSTEQGGTGRGLTVNEPAAPELSWTSGV